VSDLDLLRAALPAYDFEDVLDHMQSIDTAPH
jgi:hypothetical protein